MVSRWRRYAKFLVLSGRVDPGRLRKTVEGSEGAGRVNEAKMKAQVGMAWRMKQWDSSKKAQREGKRREGGQRRYTTCHFDSVCHDDRSDFWTLKVGARARGKDSEAWRTGRWIPGLFRGGPDSKKSSQ